MGDPVILTLARCLFLEREYYCPICHCPPNSGAGALMLVGVVAGLMVAELRVGWSHNRPRWMVSGKCDGRILVLYTRILAYSTLPWCIVGSTLKRR